MKPDSGGIAYDILSLVAFFTPKRASLGLGYVKALSFLRINKDCMQYDARLFYNLPIAAWKKSILRRYSKLPRLFSCDFAATDDDFKDPVDRNVVDRDGANSDSEEDDFLIWIVKYI